MSSSLSLFSLLSLLSLFFITGVVGADEGWVKFALSTQRDLSGDITVNRVPLIGTHNSFSSPTYAALFSNQILSLTAQLLLGVRWLEIDLHYIPELNTTQQGAFRICHASADIASNCQTYGWAICNANGIVNYGPDTGCTSGTPNFTQIFREISLWKQQYLQDILIINFDDAITSQDINGYGAANFNATINGWFRDYFGPTVYTPSDFIADGRTWPTVRNLISRGKTLILNTNGNVYGGAYVHSDLRGFVWPASQVNFFSGFPNCTSTSSSYRKNGTVDFAFFQEDLSVIVFSTIVLYNGTKTVGAFNPTSTTAAMQCGFTPFLDYYNPADAEQLVWSWEPSQPNGTACASMRVSTGNWISEDCFNTSHYFACQSVSNASSWTIGNVSASRNNYDPTTICPPGYTFSTPHTAFENLQLYNYLKLAANNSANIWISMNQYTNGTWSATPTSSQLSLTTTTTTTTTSASTNGGSTANPTGTGSTTSLPSSDASPLSSLSFLSLSLFYLFILFFN